MSQYGFAVNVITTIDNAVNKASISHDLANKLLIVKISLIERTST